MPAVLIVEDDIDIRESIQMVLESAGYRVQVADHGRQALDLLDESSSEPCLIVLDLRMPVMDGETFLEELTRTKRNALARRVVVASADRRADERVARFGVSSVLTKPFEVEDLLRAARSHCG